ncbi:alpha/beta-hydrolase [Eremomyces bilateralis CBS 781.70]|uniref:Alpha/beta-hydrolase n=1 Tax=Eremomyces bilateralis CBS 781.70 TaxID=1392243 RepID=A0A6G1GD52_9PEZI|nr:alpha/beta-hydrolase [Eremomyces bilateralis CBS 781.70]KAF1815954.1 alpha/beta-hydrolase [Eremomyces bilateralis CBS 781.70]
MRLLDLLCLLPLLSILNYVSARADGGIVKPGDHPTNSPISISLFSELEELARLVDIAYCVGSLGLGVQKPFRCVSRCHDFPHMSLVATWHTGPFLSDSCGYIAVEKNPSGPPRVIVAFRGTYSIANTIADLSTIPQAYVPYPSDPTSPTSSIATAAVQARSTHHIGSDLPFKNGEDVSTSVPCPNCTVHSGFLGTWLNARRSILPELLPVLQANYNATLHIVGHSLGGAVACLASLELLGRGWDPVVTTFGEPMVGNRAFAQYVEDRFDVGSDTSGDEKFGVQRYRRVTHINDPVPFLPLEEWGYAPHSGEIYITAPQLPPALDDIIYCYGPADANCSRSAVDSEAALSSVDLLADDMDGTNLLVQTSGDGTKSELEAQWWLRKTLGRWAGGIKNPIPGRLQLWQLFFAHRDYFWRLGLCVLGGDPWDWGGYPYPGKDAGDKIVRNEKINLDL